MSTLLEQLGGLGGVDVPRLERQPVVRLAVERVLIQLVDLSVDINSDIGIATLGRAPERFRDSFNLAAEAGALEPDNALVVEAIPRALAGFTDYVRDVARWTRSQAPS